MKVPRRSALHEAIRRGKAGEAGEAAVGGMARATTEQVFDLADCESHATRLPPPRVSNRRNGESKKR
eukprot:7320346-Prymnesium_polylepis.1